MKFEIRKYIKLLASLKLAVLIILAMGLITAIGTIVESRFNTFTALDLVYHSRWAYGIYLLLCVNLTAVIFDRYPWKKRHIGFISAHVGIIILVVGSILTRYWGLDGSLVFGVGQTTKVVRVQEVEVAVYSSMDGSSFQNLYSEVVNYLVYPPQKKSTFIPLPKDKLEIVEYWPYTLIDQKVVQTDNKVDSPAFRFQISNDRVSESQWVLGQGRTPSELNFGPAKLVFSVDGTYVYTGGNVLHLFPKSETTLSYQIFTASRPGEIKRGDISPGEFFDTGWMGLTFRLLNYYPHANMDYTYKVQDRPNKGGFETVPALKINYNNKPYWVAMNSSVQLFSDDSYYVFSFGNKRVSLDFPLELIDFKVGYYEGTMRPKTYESHVKLPEGNIKVISMNEPLKYKGFNFYQASYETDEQTGQPTRSILSVNWDPGRWLKYLGSLLIVFGIIHLFYFRSYGGKNHV